MVSRNAFIGFQSLDYRYGFSGKENDKEVKGNGDQIDYGMRIYDPRLGRFLSIDPLSTSFPWNGTYAFAENDPITFIDLDGQEKALPATSDISVIPQPTSNRKLIFAVMTTKMSCHGPNCNT